MNKRKLQILCALTCSITILLSGCTKESNQTGKEHEELKKENTTLVKENSKLEGKYEELEEQLEVIKQELDGLKEAKEVDNVQDETNDDGVTTFSIYTKKPGSDEIQEGPKTNIRSDIKVEDKLQLLADHISAIQYKKIKFEVDSVEDGNAVIKIKEITDDYEQSWVKQYFEDSEKAEEAINCLVETFLQRKYEGEWIKSIAFVYEGDPLWKNGYIQKLEIIQDR
jgi:hypothetical protein